MRLRREIMAIALPAIATNITTPILGLVDVAITGHIGEPVYIAAIAVGGTMFNILYWLFNFLRMGTSGMTARAYGAGDADTRHAVLFRSLAVGLVLGAAMLVLARPLGTVILDFLDADDAGAGFARQYFYICIWGAPAVMATYAMAGWLIGMQDTRATMWVAIATNVVNIAASATLVYGMGWKIEGVATGTLVAQWAGAILAAYIILRKYRPQRPPKEVIRRAAPLGRFFSINSDIFLRTACLVAVTLWFTHAGALQSTTVLAANAVLLQLFMLFSFFMDGFAFAGEALGGKYCGRGDRSAVRHLTRTLLVIGVIFACTFALLYLFAGGTFVDVLTDSEPVRNAAREYLPWAVAIPLCGFAAFVYDGLMVGLGHTRSMLAAMAVAMAVFFTLYFALPAPPGNHALWLAFDAYLLVRGAVEALIFRT